MVLKAMKKSCEPKAEGKKKAEILLLISLYCRETNNREKAVRLSHPHGRKRRGDKVVCQSCFSLSALQVLYSYKKRYR